MDPYAAFGTGGLAIDQTSGGLSGQTLAGATIGEPYQGTLGATTTSGGGGGSTYTAPAPSYTQAQLDAWRAQKANVYGTANDAAKTAGTGLNSSILDFVDSLRSGQRSIENRAINNELAKRQGVEGVHGMVGRGIKSGGVVLANKNASDSSAAGAIARAYGDIGRRELSNVGNQYEMGNRDVQMQQQNLEEQRASGTRKIQASKEQVVGNIVAEARNSLAALDAAAVDADLPDRIAIEQEKEAIRQQVLSQLGQYDQMLTQQTASVRPGDRASRISEATRLASLGTAPENSFQFSTEAPAQFQGSGPFAADIPLFTFRNRNRQG